MLKSFFNKKDADSEMNGDSIRDRQIVIEGQTEEAEEAMSLLAQNDQAELDDTLIEINQTLKDAARTSLRDIRLMEEGRCPTCGQKTNQFLFTSVCAHCGWFSFISPEEGKSIIHLKNNEAIECGTTFDTKGDYILGITDGVVRAKVSKQNVDYIEFAWTEEEISRKKQVRVREQAGTCSWCEKSLAEVEETVIVYSAFANLQERFVFCTEKCNESFQKQYPIRVHKNCYHRSCLDCDLCVKKFSGEDETVLIKLEEGTI